MSRIPDALLASSLFDDLKKSQAQVATLQAELAQERQQREKLHDVLQRNGFVRCDIQACNCGSWHARYGLPQRFAEIKEELADAGHPLSNKNGNVPLAALRQLVAELVQARKDAEDMRAELDARRRYMRRNISLSTSGKPAMQAGS